MPSETSKMSVLAISLTRAYKELSSPKSRQVTQLQPFLSLGRKSGCVGRGLAVSPLVWLKGKPGLWGTCSSCLNSVVQGNQALIKETQIPLANTSIFPVNLVYHFVPRWRQLNTAVTLKVRLRVWSCTWTGKGHFSMWSCNYTETSPLNTLVHFLDIKHFHKHVHFFYPWNALHGLFGGF